MSKFYFFAVATLLFFACKKEKTAWETNWVAPLVNDTLALDNLVNDSTLTVDANQLYQVDLTRTILNLGIDDILEIPDTLITHTFNSAVPSITVPPGFSFVNEIDEHKMELGQIQLKKIRVKQGKITFKVNNPLATKTYFTVELPGVTKNGAVFQNNYEVAAGSTSNPSSATAVLDISGYDMDLTGVSGGEYNTIQTRLIVKSDPSGPTVALLSSNQFKMEASFEQLKLDYARGYFGNSFFTDTITQQINLLNAYAAGMLDLPETNLNITVSNGFKLDARATISFLSSTNSLGQNIALTHPQIGSPIYLNAASGSWSSLTNSSTSLAFNGTNSNLEEYMENLGNSQTVGYKIELNPWGNVSGGWNEIFPTSRLHVKLHAQLPLTIGADGLTLRDTFNFELDQNREKSHIESGSLVLNASNAFPMSASTNLYLLDETGAVLHVIQGSSAILSANLGAIDPKDGKLKKNSEVVFLLSKEMLVDLPAIRRVAVEAVFDTPDSSGTANVPAAIPAGAFLAVRLKTKFRIKAIVG
jgi:hypothetical protein